jgi:threonine synthase
VTGNKFHLQCLACGHKMDDADVNRCPVCGGVLDIVYAEALWHGQHELSGRGLWRYFDLLPVRSRENLVTLGETETALVRTVGLGKQWGLPNLFFKVEGMNPTGSYKDRIAAVSMSRARELGKTAWVATSSGNAGASLSAYGVRAGLSGTLFVLEKASRAKIAQILTYGPRLRAVRGLGMDPSVETGTFENVRQLCAQTNAMMMVTARKFNPFGMEGVKTLAYEICEQLDRAPDVVYVPVGGGGLLSSIWKGFTEWHLLGKVSTTPRLVAVQGEGCSPVVDAWAAGHEVRPIAECKGTVSGLQLAAPPDGELGLRAVRESNGWAVAVPDANTCQMQGKLGSQEGLFAEPAGAISAAAIQMDRARGRLNGHETVVALLTGTGFKVADAIQNLTSGIEIPLIGVPDILKQ